jgi:hypothetical protein
MRGSTTRQFGNFALIFSTAAVVVVVVVVGVVVIEDDIPSSTPLPSRVVDDVIVPQLAPRVVQYFFLEEFSSIFIIYRLL